MERHQNPNAIDENILRILSLHECLTPLQLWYELGEDDGVKERVSMEEIRSRLESLREKGFVERAGAEEEGIRWFLK